MLSVLCVYMCCVHVLTSHQARVSCARSVHTHVEEKHLENTPTTCLQQHIMIYYGYGRDMLTYAYHVGASQKCRHPHRCPSNHGTPLGPQCSSRLSASDPNGSMFPDISSHFGGSSSMVFLSPNSRDGQVTELLEMARHWPPRHRGPQKDKCQSRSTTHTITCYHSTLGHYDNHQKPLGPR